MFSENRTVSPTIPVSEVEMTGNIALLLLQGISQSEIGRLPSAFCKVSLKASPTFSVSEA